MPLKLNGEKLTRTLCQAGVITGHGLTVFFDYPPAIRQIIYTTNAVESLNASLKKVLKPKKSFMDDEPMMKVIYLNTHRIASKWTMPVRDWSLALD